MLETKCRQQSGIEDEVIVETDHGTHGIGRARLSWNQNLANPMVLCAGNSGELIVRLRQSLPKTADQERVLNTGYDHREAHIALIREHLRRRCIHDTPIDTGPKTIVWIEAGYRNQRDGLWQTLTTR